MWRQRCCDEQTEQRCGHSVYLTSFASLAFLTGSPGGLRRSLFYQQSDRIGTRRTTLQRESRELQLRKDENTQEDMTRAPRHTDAAKWVKGACLFSGCVLFEDLKGAAVDPATGGLCRSLSAVEFAPCVTEQSPVDRPELTPKLTGIVRLSAFSTHIPIINF
ncbi:hypothetical protein F2P81_006470 [Scophthalmus maximus]|uniref:Uncharacterized protein n=1 Tax=Scophthalmus maximus TaxID=52904 RepID=A0A6A4TE59_SCOMX|nr:hypothetical protein F2P81_006470 [Scophthalmus maximus]